MSHRHPFLSWPNFFLNRTRVRVTCGWRHTLPERRERAQPAWRHQLTGTSCLHFMQDITTNTLLTLVLRSRREGEEKGVRKSEEARVGGSEALTRAIFRAPLSPSFMFFSSVFFYLARLLFLSKFCSAAFRRAAAVRDVTHRRESHTFLVYIHRWMWTLHQCFPNLCREWTCVVSSWFQSFELRLKKASWWGDHHSSSVSLSWLVKATGLSAKNWRTFKFARRILGKNRAN
jgi:hypothetical protein